MMPLPPPKEIREKKNMVFNWSREEGYLLFCMADITKAPPEIQKAWAEYQEWEVKSGTKAFMDAFSS